MNRNRRNSLKVLIVVALLSVPTLLAQGTDGYIKAKVRPGRAGVFIDGKYVGPAANFRMARKYAVSPGEHEVKLVDPRYDEWSSKVQVRAGKTTVLDQTLKALPLAKPPFGRLRIVGADKYAAVYVNNHYYGHADEFSNFAQALLLNPGKYEVRVEPAGGGSAITETVNIEADKEVIVGHQK
ncbi:MAG TPA: PEGA domain-containing protein [Bryobacteraceae bacterium]|nr:PEGA domain-containing protein [Bryobacteraceae bacterium]